MTASQPLTPDDLLTRGVVTHTRLYAAERAVGKLFHSREHGLVAALRVDVTLHWWWLLTPSGAVFEVGWQDITNMRRVGQLAARAVFEVRPNRRGEFASEDYVFSAHYGGLLGLLGDAVRERVAA